ARPRRWPRRCSPAGPAGPPDSRTPSAERLGHGQRAAELRLGLPGELLLRVEEHGVCAGARAGRNDRATRLERSARRLRAGDLDVRPEVVRATDVHVDLPATQHARALDPQLL